MYYNYTDLKQAGVGVAWLDITGRIKDSTALALSKNITEFWIQEMTNYGLETTCGSNPDALLHWASDQGLKYALVVATGNNLSKKNNLTHELPKFLNDNPDISVAGHILDKGDKFYELHHQCFIVNIEWWNRVGKPAIGVEEQNKAWETIKPIRSKENWHDGYTPHWVEPGADAESYTGRRFGWNIIDASLKSGKRIVSFSETIRDCKFYIYPEVDNDFHSKITETLDHLQGYAHFVANTETPPEKSFLEGKNIKGIVSTAGGITALLCAYVSDLKPHSKVSIFDFSPLSIALQKEICKPGFDFKNFKKSFYNIFGTLELHDMMRAVSNIDKMQEIIDSLWDRGLGDFIRDVWPTLDFRFTVTNLYNTRQFESMLRRHQGEETFIHLTNILHFQNTAWLYSATHRYRIEEDLFESLKRLGMNEFYMYQNRPGPGVNWRGQTPADIENNKQRYLHRVEQLRILPWIKQ